MGSVVEYSQHRNRLILGKMSAEERIELALRLGDEDLAAHAARTGKSLRECLELHRAQRQKGRRRSACARGDDAR